MPAVVFANDLVEVDMVDLMVLGHGTTESCMLVAKAFAQSMLGLDIEDIMERGITEICIVDM